MSIAASHPGSVVTAPPNIIVIFGGSGDLTRRKLVPAVYNLLLDGLLPAQFAVVGTARRDLTDEAFVEDLRQGVEDYSRQPLDPEGWAKVAACISYVALLAAGRPV